LVVPVAQTAHRYGHKGLCSEGFSRGVPLDAKANILGMERKGEQVMIRFVDCEDGVEKLENFDYVLAATGRSPNVKNFGLENTRSGVGLKRSPNL
jgi:dihydrolipoamide dehydrogenase